MLSRRVPDLPSLETLLAVARRGSLNAAAADLRVSQQAVSRRMKMLESQLGITLVFRSSHGSRLTPAGLIVAQWASKIIDAATELDAGVRALRTGTHAHLRIASSLTIAEHLLPGWLVTLQTRQAELGLTVTKVELEATNSDNVAERVRAGSADLGFVEGPYPPGGLRSRTIAADTLLIVVPPSHPWARRRHPITPMDLARTPLVSREQGSGTRQALEQALTTSLADGAKVAPPLLELSNAVAVRSAAVAGAGPAALSSLAAAEDIAAGRLKAVTIDGLNLRRTLRAIWTGTQQPPAGPARDLIAIAAAPHAATTAG